MRLISKALHLFYLGGIIFKLDHKNRASLRWLHSKWLYPVSRVWDAVNDAICLCYMAQGRLIEVHIELSNLRLNLYRFSLRTFDKTPVTLIVPTLKSVSGLLSQSVSGFLSQIVSDWLLKDCCYLGLTRRFHSVGSSACLAPSPYT